MVARVSFDERDRMGRGVRYILFLSLMALAGCATDPLHEKERYRYSNPAMSFSAYIPNEWRLNDLLPEGIQKEVGLRFLEGFEGPFFFNEATDGVIVFGGAKDNWSWRGFEKMPDDYKDRIASQYTDAVIKGIVSRSIDHNRYEENLHITGRNWIQNRSNFKPEKMVDFISPSRASRGYTLIYGEIFLYPCDRDRSCTLVLILGSKCDRHVADMASFNAILSSIRAHDPE